MGKKAVIISSISEAREIVNYVDAYLVPLDELSINYIHTFSIDEIEEIIKLGKEVFVIINKNIHNNELTKLESDLKKIDKLNINGIIFYDIALVQLKKELGLKTDLVWNQEHLTTNYGSVNYWKSKGVRYAYLSSEITKREVDEIRNNTDALIFVNVFGYIPMFTSRRHLVDNYSDTFSVDKGNKIFKEGKYYNIFDSKNGTVVYSTYVLNVRGIDADYLVYNSNLIDNFVDVLKDNKYKEESGFLYKETIYKVK